MSKIPIRNTFPLMPPIDGVQLSSLNAGISKSDNDDLMLAKVCSGATIAGLFTRSKTSSASVKWCRNNLEKTQDQKKPLGLIVNSGNANVFTGKYGEETVKRTALSCSLALNSTHENIFIASTGVIGEFLDYHVITSQIDTLKTRLKEENFLSAAKAIMTTDTYPKGAFRKYNIDGETIYINGIAKGSGMIAPDMATMLVFIFTNISIAKGVLQKILKKCNKKTFNSITVDSDTSTSDTLLCVATGRAKMDVVESVNDPRAQKFGKQLRKVMENLAHLVVKDGEGASKFIEVKVTSAKNKKSAAKVAKTIANSPLVKTAIAGEDPNWGRIVMAIGKSGEEIREDNLTIYIGPHVVAKNGSRSKTYSESKVANYMKNDSLIIIVDLGIGSAQASIFTCDLTHDYVSINADYRS